LTRLISFFTVEGKKREIVVLRTKFLAVGLLVTMIAVLILVTVLAISATHDLRTPPPATITGLIATDASYARHGQIGLTWSPSDAEDFAYYLIYASDTEITDVAELSPIDRINDRTDVTYQATNYGIPWLGLALVENTEYWFAVTAVDLAGNESKVELSVSATIESMTPPPPIPTVFIRVTYTTGFDPATATVPVGTTVAWTNIDELYACLRGTANPHTVTSDTGLFRFHAELIPTQDIFSYTFIQTGVFGYHCELHPGEIGTVIVERVDEQLPGAKGAG
jgi:plastocyanin